MALFSERYGYINLSDVLIREEITLEIQNAICSWYDELFQDLYLHEYMVIHIWMHFLNKRKNDFYTKNNNSLVTDYIISVHHEWFYKLDMVEFSIKFLYNYGHPEKIKFIERLNHEFARLHFAYRIVNNEIVEITSKEEIKTIENALHHSPNNIKMHLNTALELYAQRPVPDARNSIKESISAVEAFCREKTGKSTLGEALKELKKNRLQIPDILNDAFLKLYTYTNQPNTGIRHALMEDENTPTADEALFMLVSCSAFINYLIKKFPK